ncbi:hypothetical protein [Dongia sp.]|uniref:hypothetical protein n=1 Tax=Dongia sp. TaxID=1977262 RepID=UPI003752E15F
MAKAGEQIETREAAHGQKMIEVRLRFWTDDIAEKGKVQPKHAWSSGIARIAANSSHGIKSGEAVPFNSALEIGAAVAEVLIAHGITLHTSRKDRKFIKDPA